VVSCAEMSRPRWLSWQGSGEWLGEDCNLGAVSPHYRDIRQEDMPALQRREPHELNSAGARLLPSAPAVSGLRCALDDAGAPDHTGQELLEPLGAVAGS
jgi:hypothetical protein